MDAVTVHVHTCRLKNCWKPPLLPQKTKKKGEVIRNKVWVVAKGYSQVEGINYTNTYVPVTRMESMWTLLHVSTSLDWEIHQLDVKTAFLHSNLEEEIYMEQPEECQELGKEDWVCKLNKTTLWTETGGLGLDVLTPSRDDRCRLQTVRC